MNQLKIFSNFGFNFEYYSDKPCELYVDCFPNTPKDCLRFLWVAEPNGISNLNDTIIKKHKEFDLILTFDEKVLSECPNAILFLYGTTWIDNFDISVKKEFCITSLVGGKSQCDGHKLRHNVVDNRNLVKEIPLILYNSKNFPYPNKSDFIEMKNTINKNELFYSQYHIAIENNRTKNYFTEKLVDCFQTKTIPIYFGCTNIGDYFDTRGIFQVDSIEEIIHVCNSLRENTYDKMLEFVETNYRLSMDYVDIISKIKNNINKKIKNMQTLEEIYEKNASTPSDINEHLPTLKKYAQECETIVEMGVRTIVSTWAFLSGNPKKLISVDYKYPIDYNSNDLPIVENIAKEKNIDFSFVLGDTRNLTIPECDLLFIDTLHTYSQIKIELNLHSPKVKKYIIFHDTVSFRHIGENNLDKGIWPAIEEFLSQNPEWKIHEVYENNNGLTVIKRN